MKRISSSITLAIDAKAKEMKAAGVDIVGFGAGEPDFNTPQPIIDAAKLALEQGLTKYTAVGGTLALREAIAANHKHRHAVDCSAQNVIVSVGGKQVLYNLAMVLLEPGDRVLIPCPYWVSYPPQVELADGVPIILPCSEEDRFLLTPERLEAALDEHQPRMLILNSPSNPTGQAYHRHELAALCEVLRAHPTTILVWDAIYEHLVYDGFKHSEPLSIAPDLRDRIVTVNGFSKAYAMTGWRLGYGIGPKPIIDDMIKLQGHCTSNATTFVQAAGLAALALPQTSIDEMVAVFAKRRQRMLSLLADIPGLRCLPPPGAFYTFPNVQAFLGKRFQGELIEDDLQLAGVLLEKAAVAVVPGSAFGAPGFIRLSYATSMEQIEKGVQRIAEALAQFE
jgi:aspartate aminotransferase